MTAGMVSQWRVTWRRAGWVQSKSRTYASEAKAVGFADRIRRPVDDLAPVVDLSIDVRVVEARWREHTVILTEKEPVR